MLGAVPKLTKKIDVGLGCIDHMINLIVKSTQRAVPEINQAISECKDLSNRVHTSPSDHQRIRRECNNLKNDSTEAVIVKYRKIITPVDTRWNSTLMMIKSINLLRPALESLSAGRYEEEDKTDVKLKAAIPSAVSFEIIEQVIPILEKAKLLSETLSGDEKPTMHQVFRLRLF
jgi:hypothetical protein